MADYPAVPDSIIAAQLVERGISFSYLRPTATAFRKSILETSREFRDFIKNTGIHNFGIQANGVESKRIVPVELITTSGLTVESSMSLYKSRTRGDERVWIKSAGNVVAPGGVMLVAAIGDHLCVFDGTDAKAFQQWVLPKLAPRHDRSSIFVELLNKLLRLGERGFILAPEAGASSVGRLLEDELGIPMNSSRNPDYRGIEVKAARITNARSTLFAQVPNWEISRLKSPSDILSEFGYDTPEGRKLSCTISVRSANAQSLFLHVDRDRKVLHARSRELDPLDVVAWPLATLEDRLAQKHAETVWVDAISKFDGEKEYIRFVAVERTTDPIMDEFTRMLRRGKITVDFLIRPDGDKGFLFKIKPSDRGGLFGGSRRFSLI